MLLIANVNHWMLGLLHIFSNPNLLVADVINLILAKHIVIILVNDADIKLAIASSVHRYCEMIVNHGASSYHLFAFHINGSHTKYLHFVGTKIRSSANGSRCHLGRYAGH